MARIIYVNGEYLPYDQAHVHSEDRGFQFGDAVYEVCEVRNRQLIDEERHMVRLSRSLDELGMTKPLSSAGWGLVMREVIRRNRVITGMVYLQVSRGVGPRNFLYPPEGTPPTVVCLARSTLKAPAPESEDAPKMYGALKVMTTPDIRWGRCDIKTVMLLPASMAKQAAKAEGADDVWFTDGDDNVTEGGSSNAWIITKDGKLVTRHITNDILRGITRTTLIDLLEKKGLTFEERAFSREEALDAKEAFITSATNPVTPVVKIDDQFIGNGHPGEMSIELHEAFHSVATHT